MFAEYERRWIDTVSAARLRVIANFFLLKYVVVGVVCLGVWELRLWRIDNVM